VFDPISARIAESLGFEIGMYAGSVASAIVLGAPDLTVITLSEFADQARRITRASSISVIADADHGYGNALNVMRTVEEMEAAGVSALTIEDTVLPGVHGRRPGDQVIPEDEMVGKLRAALTARQDQSLVIIGRTSAMGAEGLEGTLHRVRAYAAAGVDALFFTGVTTREEVQALHAATELPMMLGSAPATLHDPTFLAANGVRIALRGHMAFQVTVKAVYDAMTHQKEGGGPEGLQEQAASAELMAQVLRSDEFKGWQQGFLGMP
jgi:carboxyvinyl-carboxyphosphonate phosphorylmutase